MPILFKGKQDISSIKNYLYARPSTIYTTMRLSGRTGKVFELEMHLERLKATPIERELIEEKLKELYQEISGIENNKNKDLRITLIRRSEEAFSFDLMYEEMTTLEMESCQVEICLGKRSNVQEKNSQWVK